MAGGLVAVLGGAGQLVAGVGFGLGCGFFLGCALGCPLGRLRYFYAGVSCDIAARLVRGA